MFIDSKLRTSAAVIAAARESLPIALPTCVRAPGRLSGQRRQLLDVHAVLPDAGNATLVIQVRQLYKKLEQVRQAGVSSAEIRSALEHSPIEGQSWHKIAAACQAGAGWDPDLLHVLRCHALRSFQLQVAQLLPDQRILFQPLLELLVLLNGEDAASTLKELPAMCAQIVAATPRSGDHSIGAAIVALDDVLALMAVVCVHDSERRLGEHRLLSEVAKQNYSAARRALADTCKRESVQHLAQRAKEQRAISAAVHHLYSHAWRWVLAHTNNMTKQQLIRG